MEENKKSEPVKPCPHCRKEISALAKKCPYCQSDVRNFVNRHPIITVFVVGFVIVIIFSVFGGLGNSLSNSVDNSGDATQPQATQPQESQQQMALQACLSLAQQSYSDAWDSTCKDAGKSPNCKLSSLQAEVLDNRLQGSKDDCYHQFPQ